MSLLQRFGYRRQRADEAALEQQVTALRSALSKCKSVAREWRRMRRITIAGVAVLMLGLGFGLGVYHDEIAQHARGLLASVGLAGGPPRDAEAGYAAYQKGNYDTALEIVRPLAEKGDARAQSTLGLLYYRGRGVPLNEAAAARWFRLAADQGDAIAQFNLGVMYAEGQGVPQDHAESAKWYRRAADQGYAQAQYNLGLWYAQGEGGEPDNVRAHMWLNLAAARFPTSDTRNRNAAVVSRDTVASRMTPDEIAEAQRMAREWKPKG